MGSAALDNRLLFLEATSTSPEQPTVLFNTSAINYVEIRSQLAGKEQCRVVLTNGQDYVLHDAERAGSLLRQLRQQGIAQSTETAIGAGGARRG